MKRNEKTRSHYLIPLWIITDVIHIGTSKSIGYSW